ncbi:hypothetical protein [Bdellovibrio sp. ZAP7]|uniref:hypothetical protein n=1 Tax=Bdellovibrio sp. ZAP7 TaxID=2231053 RepID=UPI00115C2B88|nr:hypothetical protein [Bdellovibrio sp. ZAP7]
MSIRRICAGLNLKASLWLFILFTAVLPFHAHGAHSCEYVFAEELLVVPRVFYKRIVSKNLVENSAQNNQIKAQIAKLAEAVLHENSRTIEKGRAYNKVHMTDFTVADVKLMPGNLVDGYGLFIVKLINKHDGDIEFEQIRSNGYAAFVDRSFQFRDGISNDPVVRRFKASYVDENGTIKTADQGEIFISSLPDQINLSRVMNQTEREQWVDGKPIKTDPFGARTHFAVNYFKFQKQEPYLIPFSKEQLLNAYRRGDVEINTYDMVSHNELWHGKVDLEFEVVFTGIKSMETLRPLLQETLRQDILPFK